MSREKVLSLLLEQGDSYVSGEAMSRVLGISRAAVWKAIEALRQEGYEIQSAPSGAIGWSGPRTGSGRGTGRAAGGLSCGQPSDVPGRH